MEGKVLSATLQSHTRSVKLMGNIFSFNVVSRDEGLAQHGIDEAIAEIKRIESLLTTFKEDSQVNQINRCAGVSAVVVDREVFDLVKRSIRISDLTQGAFDITYGSIDKSLWNFDRTMTSLPDPATAKRMVHLINYRNIILNDKDCSVMLSQRGMRIGFGGIGKGYAADRAKEVLLEMGFTSGIVNASGDLTAWGYRPDGNPWTISIADPDTKTPFSHFPVSNMSVATSGSYEKFITVQGKRYSHTIDPRTGLPTTGVKSVTVISPIAELSDALATPITVMGVKAGIYMMNQLKNVACVIIDDNNKIYTTQNISIQ
jgi:thiamine biosynthesis lipoprotein